MIVMIAHRIITLHPHTCPVHAETHHVCNQANVRVTLTHTFVLNFLKCKTRSCKYQKHMLLCLVAYELTDAVRERSLAVCSHRVINHCPWMYGNGLQTLSTPISCNYEPGERWIQGEYDFRLSLTSWLMVWWVRFPPVMISQAALSPLKLSTAGYFFQRLMEAKRSKGFSWSASPDCLYVSGQVTLLIISFVSDSASKWSESLTWDKNKNYKR